MAAFDAGTPRTRKEALFVVCLWIAACLYTVGYAALFAYRKETVPSLLWGIPTWVWGGILAPWAVCALVSLWFAFRGMEDESLGEDHDLPETTDDCEGRDE